MRTTDVSGGCEAPSCDVEFKGIFGRFVSFDSFGCVSEDERPIRVIPSTTSEEDLDHPVCSLAQDG